MMTCNARRPGRSGHWLGLLALLVLLALPPALAAAAAVDPLAAALEAELALVDDDHARAARAYAQAAEASQRAEFAERAARIALYAEDAALAARMAGLWHRLAPSDRGAAQAAALAQLQLGQTAEAVAALRELQRSGSAADRETLLRTLAGAPPEAGLKALRALSADGAFAAGEPDQYSPIELAVRFGDLELAQRLAAESIAAHPKSARAWLWQALVQAASDDKAAAAASYQKALQYDPGNVELRLSYVQVLNELGRKRELRKLLEDAPSSHPSLYAALLALAVSEQDRRQYPKLRRRIERDRTLVASERSFLLGQLAELSEQPDAALAHYAAVDDLPRRYDARLRMAVLDFPQRREQALAHLRDIQDSGAEQAAQAFLLEAELLSGVTEYDHAILALSRGLSVYLDHTQLLYARALAYANLDAVEQVESDLRRVLELEPQNAAALNALGYTLADRTERHAEAYDLIKRAYALNSEDAATLDSLGWVLFRLGRHAEALEYLRKAYAASPDAEIAAHLGEVLWTSGDRSAATTLLRKALAADTQGNRALRAVVQRLLPELLQ